MKPGPANETLGYMSGERALNHAVAGTLDLSVVILMKDTNLGCWYRV